MSPIIKWTNDHHFVVEIFPGTFYPLIILHTPWIPVIDSSLKTNYTMNTSIASTPKTGMTVPVTKKADQHRSEAVQKALLICGILSSLWYVAINIIVPMQYPGYSIAAQTVSELSAIGAPTRPLWVWLCIPYSLLAIAFGWGVWRAAGGSRQLRTAGAFMLLYGFSGFFWPPMHQREVLAAGGGTLTDTLHIVFSVVAVGFMMIMMGFGAAAFGKRFRFFTITSFVLFLVFGTLTGLEGPRISENLPTPLIGVWERINIAIYMIWVIVFANLLLRREKNAASTTQATPVRSPLN
jgi:hypothetical protein